MIPLVLNNGIKMKESINNVPIRSRKNVPNDGLVLGIDRRRYVKRDEVNELADYKYTSNGMGITFNDIISRFGVSKKKAQRTLKHLRMDKVLFTIEDLVEEGITLNGLKRTNPQEYYSTKMKAKIIEDKGNNVPIDTTGTNPLESHSMANLSYIFNQLNSPYLYIHKLQIKTKIDKEHYDELRLPTKGSAKFLLERIREPKGQPDVEYLIYPTGTIMISVSCSSTPFRLHDDGDISNIILFLGRVEDRLKSLLSDTRNKIVPSALLWILMGCDINKDVEINNMMQLTGLNIQVKSSIGVFRGYVKRIGDRVIYRTEKSLTLNEPLSGALENLRTNTDLDKDFQLSFDNI